MHASDPVTGLGVRLELVARLVSGEPVRWTFAVTNGSNEPRLLTFTSSQQGDVVLEAAGVERYRWSKDRFFAAVIATKELPVGEEWVFALEDMLSIEPGTYSLLATVTAQPEPPGVQAEIVVVPAD